MDCGVGGPSGGVLKWSILIGLVGAAAGLPRNRVAAFCRTNERNLLSNNVRHAARHIGKGYRAAGSAPRRGAAAASLPRFQ